MAGLDASSIVASVFGPMSDRLRLARNQRTLACSSIGRWLTAAFGRALGYKAARTRCLQRSQRTGGRSTGA
jgi:hypothetical protein